MQSVACSSRHGDGSLWLIALGLSLLTNTAILATVGFVTLKSIKLREKAAHVVEPPAPSVAMIYPEVAERPAMPTTTGATATAPTPEITMTTGPRFARTSPDQSAARPDTPAFMGERNTRATSDRAPDPTAPAMPSQAGITPKNAADMETTESDYQDGSLASTHTAAPATAPATTPPTPDPLTPVDPLPAMETAVPPPRNQAGQDTATATPPPREELIDGPQPVDMPVLRDVATAEEIPAPPAKRQETTGSPSTAETPKPVNYRDPGFKGFQRKTAVTGSISRTGRSALDVEDSPLGRYQATLSRAVEQEWQRNCVRHRDYITPGFLTVRFFVEPGGKVRSVQFVGDMATGEVQKGFTLNSIRDAEIPPMPPALRKQYNQEPLELIFRFYF